MNEYEQVTFTIFKQLQASWKEKNKQTRKSKIGYKLLSALKGSSGRVGVRELH